MDQAISLLLPRSAHHSNRIGAMDTEIFLMSMSLMHLTDRVHYLEEERDMM